MGIFVGVPVYDGVGLVAESLRSIQAQDHDAFSVHISVDGDDRGSALACEPFLADPRFRMTVQPRRLGWAANLNWLMERCDQEFFCYWQQDDLCDASYLRVLAAEAGRDSRAVCVYADLQWFGTRSDRVSTPSSSGGVLERVLDQIEHGHYVPFRGLVRRAALRAVGGIRLTPNNSALEDQVWLARLVAHGPWRRAEGTTYFKRGHESETHRAWERSDHDAVRRSTWLEWGIGMLEVAIGVADPHERGALVELVLGRLTEARPSRWLFYDPAAHGTDVLDAFRDEFRRQARERLGVVSPEA